MTWLCWREAREKRVEIARRLTRVTDQYLALLTKKCVRIHAGGLLCARSLALPGHDGIEPAHCLFNIFNDYYGPSLGDLDSNQVWPYQAVDAASPTTPSISLIQAYRDGVLVHLPTNMLVEGMQPYRSANDLLSAGTRNSR